jgi:hypothetical protein
VSGFFNFIISTFLTSFLIFILSKYHQTLLLHSNYFTDNEHVLINALKVSAVKFDTPTHNIKNRTINIVSRGLNTHLTNHYNNKQKEKFKAVSRASLSG